MVHHSSEPSHQPYRGRFDFVKSLDCLSVDYNIIRDYLNKDLLEQLLVVQHHLLEECPLEEGDIVVTLEVEEKVVVETTKNLDLLLPMKLSRLMVCEVTHTLHSSYH